MPEALNFDWGKIFVRRDGQTIEITRQEWDEEHPNEEPFTTTPSVSNVVYTANITHNLNTMADVAGIYDALWRPEEIGIVKARDLIAPLEKGLELLRSDPVGFSKLNPSNGWGSYDVLVCFVGNYLDACRQFPDADVSVWR
jgi:hypothetical protein